MTKGNELTAAALIEQQEKEIARLRAALEAKDKDMSDWDRQHRREKELLQMEIKTMRDCFALLGGGGRHPHPYSYPFSFGR